MEELELQQDLQRYVARFCEAVAEAMNDVVGSRRARVGDAALRQLLLYASSALDIASGPVPEVALLDMAVFVRLCRKTVERHWMPHVYGLDAGRPIADAFEELEREIGSMTGNVLDAADEQRLVEAIDGWLATHPAQTRVEGVRLDDVAGLAGAGPSGRAERARGLLPSVKSVARSADRALAMAERIMFVANRMPFLVRLQVRLAAREVVSDAIERLVLGPDAPPFVLARRAKERLGRRTTRVRALAGRWRSRVDGGVGRVARALRPARAPSVRFSDSEGDADR